MLFIDADFYVHSIYVALIKMFRVDMQIDYMLSDKNTAVTSSFKIPCIFKQCLLTIKILVESFRTNILQIIW